VVGKSKGKSLGKGKKAPPEASKSGKGILRCKGRDKLSGRKDKKNWLNLKKTGRA